MTPAGGLAAHVDAKRFLPHIPAVPVSGGRAPTAIYIASGIATMERGTISMDRETNGNEVYADLEFALRSAVPRRRLHDVAHANTPWTESFGSTSTGTWSTV